MTSNCSFMNTSIFIATQSNEEKFSELSGPGMKSGVYILKHCDYSPLFQTLELKIWLVLRSDHLPRHVKDA